jgi:hypothetical protein
VTVVQLAQAEANVPVVAREQRAQFVVGRRRGVDTATKELANQFVQ